jgi:long-chain acyl-CoA synthetase
VNKATVVARVRNAFSFLRAFFRGKLEKAPVSERPYPWEASYPEGVRWDADIPVKPLPALVDEAVSAFSGRPCLEFLGKKYSYKEFGALVARAAKGFQELGVAKGVRVGLFLPNSPYYVICYHAVLKAGGTVVNFNPLYAEREIARQINDSGARILVTMNLNSLYRKLAGRLQDTCLETIVACRMTGALPFPENALFALMKRSEVSSIPSDERHIKFDKLVANDGALEPVEIDPEKDVAVLQYTGGTTGLPTGAELTHANLHANVVQTRMWATGIKPGEEKMLAVLPLFHVFGMTSVMNVGLMIGAEIVLLPRFKVSEVLKTIDKQRPTVFMGVPTMYSAINGQKELDKYDLSSLNYCLSGGAALPMSIKTTFETLTGCVLVEGYGLTEAGPVCTINPFTGTYRADSIGLPIPGTTVKIASLKHPDKLVPLGEHGEICVAGPQVMAGYRNSPEANETAFVGGHLHTGDVGYMDADGYVYLIDRIKDLIITGGFNVYPRMVEEAIYLHPAVEEVVVCGVPDAHRGEVIKAYVKLRDGAELKATALREFLKDKLASFEIPRRVEFRQELPKTLIGKPSRRTLIEEELRKAKKTKKATRKKPERADAD